MTVNIAILFTHRIASDLRRLLLPAMRFCANICARVNDERARLDWKSGNRFLLTEESLVTARSRAHPPMIDISTAVSRLTSGTTLVVICEKAGA